MGISAELDSFLVLYGIANLVIGVIGICVVTNLTPIAKEKNSADQTLEFLVEGIKIGSVATLLGWAASLSYLLFVAPRSEGLDNSLVLGAVVPLVIPFALLSEYQVALFLSRDQQLPAISGNVMLSAPLIVALFYYDLNVLSYAIALVIVFALRSIVFFAVLFEKPSLQFSIKGAIVRD